MKYVFTFLMRIIKSVEPDLGRWTLVIIMANIDDLRRGLFP